MRRGECGELLWREHSHDVMFMSDMMSHEAHALARWGAVEVDAATCHLLP